MLQIEIVEQNTTHIVSCSTLLPVSSESIIEVIPCTQNTHNLMKTEDKIKQVESFFRYQFCNKMSALSGSVSIQIYIKIFTNTFWSSSFIYRIEGEEIKGEK